VKFYEKPNEFDVLLFIFILKYQQHLAKSQKIASRPRLWFSAFAAAGALMIRQAKWSWIFVGK
jgi:hypothetical protein